VQFWRFLRDTSLFWMSEADLMRVVPAGRSAMSTVLLPLVMLVEIVSDFGCNASIQLGFIVEVAETTAGWCTFLLNAKRRRG